MPRPSGTSSYRAFSVTVVSGGTGYAIGNTLTFVGGTLAQGGVATQIIVTGIGLNNSVSTISITVNGSYSSLATVPTNPIVTTASPSGGTGATFNATWALNVTAFTAIQPYGTHNANTTPTTLSVRELYVNTARPSMWVGNAGGTPVKLVGTLGAQDASSVNITGGAIRLTNFIPNDNFDVATKTYVDSRVAGTNILAPAIVATTVNITLSGLQVIDGYTTLVGDRVLVKNQSTASQNGVYIASSTAWARSTDANTPSQLNGASILVTSGNINRGITFIQTAVITTIGTSSITFSALSQVSSIPIDATTGLSYTNNVLGFIPPGTNTTGQYNLLQAVPTGVGNATAWQSVRGVQAPTQNSDIATKLYVDTVASGLNPTAGVAYATNNASLPGTYQIVSSGLADTITGTATNTALVIDGTTINTLGTRILVKDQGVQGVASATEVSAGSGYTIGDILTVQGGTPVTSATLTVAAISGGGGILIVTVSNAGNYTDLPSNPVSVTGGTGTGATFNLVYGSTQYENGIYTLTTLPAVGVAWQLTRASDFNMPAEFPRALVNVTSGSANAGTAWVCLLTSNPTVGITPIPWAQYGGSAGNLVVPKGGTGVGNIPTGNIPFGNNMDPIGTNPALFWDQNNARFGLGTQTPLALLHVEGTTRLQQAMEKVNVDGQTTLGGTYVVQTGQQGVIYFTNSATSNFSFNFVSNSSPSVTLNSVLPIGHSVTAVVITTQGPTPFYCLNTLQVDGTTTGVTTRWSGSSAPSFGFANSFDVYLFTIIKTAATPSYTIIANRNQFGG